MYSSISSTRLRIPILQRKLYTNLFKKLLFIDDCSSLQTQQNYGVTSNAKKENPLASLTSKLAITHDSIDSIVSINVHQGSLAFSHITLDESDDSNDEEKVNKYIANIESLEAFDIERTNPAIEIDKLLAQVRNACQKIPEAKCYVIQNPTQHIARNLSSLDILVLLQQAKIFGMVQGFLYAKKNEHAAHIYHLEETLMQDVLSLNANKATFSHERLKLLKSFLRHKSSNPLPWDVSSVLPKVTFTSATTKKLETESNHKQRNISNSFLTCLAFCKILFMSK